MSDDRSRLEKRPFSQRHGYSPLPKPMQLEEISDELRRELWNHVRRVLMSGVQTSYFENSPYFPPSIESSIERILGRLFKESEDSIDTSPRIVMQRLKAVVYRGKFHQLLDLIEFILHEKLDVRFPELVADAFETYGSSYRLRGLSEPFQFVPCSTNAQAEAMSNALEIIHENGMKGAEAHLQRSVEHINHHRYAESIANSIHAVESVVRIIDPKKNTRLGPALNSLEKEGILKHKTLKDALLKLYGYTCGEEGIRHALIRRDAANVGLDEAMFMFGSCAAFSAYLTQISRR